MFEDTRCCGIKRILIQAKDRFHRFELYVVWQLFQNYNKYTEKDLVNICAIYPKISQNMSWRLV